MKKLIFSLCIVLLISCNSKTKEVSEIDSTTFYSKIFHEIDSISLDDCGDFWDVPLNGPLMFIDPETRKFFSNHDGPEISFKKIGEIFTDTLPSHLNIANTSFNWQDIRWTMVMLPLPKETANRNNLIFHELFHRIQPSIGFRNLLELSNAHLDAYNGRLLMRLELQALLAAISSEGQEQREHITNALRFRTERQSTKEVKAAENNLELNEGLAEYTGLVFSNRSTKKIKEHFAHTHESFLKNKTFVRSFAYHTIPMYGYLLSDWKKNWHKEISRESYMTEYFAKSFGVEANNSKTIEAIAIEHNYNYEEIVEEEQQRETKRLKIIEDYKELFLEKTTLKLNFENMQVSFDPRNIVPIDGLGTVYPSMRISDNWGILVVEQGALMSSDWSFVKVTEPINIGDDMISGNGWKLELNEDYRIVKNDSSYALSKR